jgi:hypothetical protein
MVAEGFDGGRTAGALFLVDDGAGVDTTGGTGFVLTGPVASENNPLCGRRVSWRFRDDRVDGDVAIGSGTPAARGGFGRVGDPSGFVFAPTEGTGGTRNCVVDFRDPAIRVAFFDSEGGRPLKPDPVPTTSESTQMIDATTVGGGTLATRKSSPIHLQVPRCGSG